MENQIEQNQIRLRNELEQIKRSNENFAHDNNNLQVNGMEMDVDPEDLIVETRMNAEMNFSNSEIANMRGNSSGL